MPASDRLRTWPQMMVGGAAEVAPHPTRPIATTPHDSNPTKMLRPTETTDRRIRGWARLRRMRQSGKFIAPAVKRRPVLLSSERSPHGGDRAANRGSFQPRHLSWSARARAESRSSRSVKGVHLLLRAEGRQGRQLRRSPESAKDRRRTVGWDKSRIPIQDRGMLGRHQPG